MNNKIYSTDTREKLIVDLFKKKESTFNTQEVTKCPTVYYTVMNNLQRVTVSFWKWRLDAPLVRKLIDPEDKRKRKYILTIEGEHYAELVNEIRKMEKERFDKNA